jgi:predicted choloylglycine hydrolase
MGPRQAPRAAEPRLSASARRFVFAREARPGADWAARFATGRDEALAWYLGQGRSAAPGPARCRAALQRHMPELLAAYDEACALVGDDPLAHCAISHWRPAPSAGGCTQAVWLGDGGPALLRNYDFAPGAVSERFESTAWFGREVICKAQRPWGGCLDGMNAAGLVASLTAGGGGDLGAGFSILLVLRYLLETCATVEQGIAALRRLPLAQSQNVTLLDRGGAYATLFLGPGRAPGLSRLPACANHQEMPLEAHGSAARQATVLAALAEPGMTLGALAARFRAAPLLSRDPAWLTVYGAVYRPAEGRVDYVWPGRTVSQRLGGFQPGDYLHDYATESTSP